MESQVTSCNLEVKHRRGFTLVEIIVSLAIFSMVATVALGALMKIINANKKAQSLQDSISSLSFAIESMSRELRTGTTFFCDDHPFMGSSFTNPKSCPSGGSSIAFRSSKALSSDPSCNPIYAYKFSVIAPGNLNKDIKKAQQTACSGSGSNIGSDAPYVSIVSENVKITDYYLVVPSSETGKYPLAFISVSGYAGIREQDKTYFNLQTAVSARSLEQ